MLDFCETLKAYIDRSGLSITAAAEHIGVNRTTLQKILSGDRKIKDIETVTEYANKLMLNSDELEDLIVKYNISIMGKEVYARRKKVKNVITSMFSDARYPYCSYESVFLENEKDRVITFNDSAMLKQAIFRFVSLEAKSGSDVTIIAQPSKAINSIINGCFQDVKSDATISHYFCMDNCFSGKNPNEQNLDILTQTFELAVSVQNYKPYYYYDNINSHINTTSLLPYCIIMNKHVICFNTSFSMGIIYSNSKIIDFYKSIVEKLEEFVKPFFKKMKCCNDLIDFYSDITVEKYVFSYQPCIMQCIPKHMIMSHINDNELSKEEIQKYTILLENGSNMFYKYKPCIIFSRSGIEEFMRNGKIYEIPENFYIKPNEEERHLILDNMIKQIENNKANYRMLKDSEMLGRRKIVFDLADEHFKITNCEDNNFKMFNISEYGIIYSMFDFFEYVSKSDAFYSTDEMLSVLKDL